MPRFNDNTAPVLAFNEDSTALLKLIRNKSLITSNTPISVQKLIVSFSIGFGTHLFGKCHKNLRLRNKKKSVKLHKKDGWSRRVHCDRVMKGGIHFIEFEINNLSKDVSIGISNSRCGVTRFVGFDENSYALTCRGRLQHQSDADFADPYSSKWRTTPFDDDDIIGMELNLCESTLKYYKNGTCLGTAFTVHDTGNDGYVFAVSMAVKGDMVSIVCDEPDEDKFFDVVPNRERHIQHSNTNNRSRKRRLEHMNTDDDRLLMPPPAKKQKVEVDGLHSFVEKQRASKFGMDANEVIANPFYIGQNIEIYDIDSKKWVKAVVIHNENNWIMVHFDGTSSIYDQKIHVMKHKERIRSGLKVKERNDADDDDKEEEDVPDEFCDPISYEVMKQPMLVTVSGITYEKEIIEEYIKENGQDPMTRQQITIDQIVPNRALRESIERWKKKHPGVIDE